MKTAKTFIFILGFIFYNHAHAYDGSPYLDFEGNWYTEANRAMWFYAMGDQLIGNTTVEYTDYYGYPIGHKIEYNFIFDTFVTDNQIIGRLTTYDSFYRCSLDNGSATFTSLDDGRARIVFYKAIFQPRTCRVIRRIPAGQFLSRFLPITPGP
ncbi:MAG: hypothetical protein AABZ06_11830 [Bdellovibrionota bacterium]